MAGQTNKFIVICVISCVRGTFTGSCQEKEVLFFSAIISDLWRPCLQDSVVYTINTIKSDRVYGKIRAQLEVEVAGTDELDRNQNTFAGGSGDRRAELLARKEARSGGGRPIDERETFEAKVDKEFSK